MGFSITDLVISSWYSREKFVTSKAQSFSIWNIQTDLVLFSCFNVTNMSRTLYELQKIHLRKRNQATMPLYRHFLMVPLTAPSLGAALSALTTYLAQLHWKVWSCWPARFNLVPDWSSKVDRFFRPYEKLSIRYFKIESNVYLVLMQKSKF